MCSRKQSDQKSRQAELARRRKNRLRNPEGWQPRPPAEAEVLDLAPIALPNEPAEDRAVFDPAACHALSADLQAELALVQEAFGPLRGSFFHPRRHAGHGRHRGLSRGEPATGGEPQDRALHARGAQRLVRLRRADPRAVQTLARWHAQGHGHREQVRHLAATGDRRCALDDEKRGRGGRTTRAAVRFLLIGRCNRSPPHRPRRCERSGPCRARGINEPALGRTGEPPRRLQKTVTPGRKASVSGTAPRSPGGFPAGLRVARRPGNGCGGAIERAIHLSWNQRLSGIGQCAILGQ